MHHALTEAVMNAVGGRTDVFLDERVQLFAHTAGALAMQIRCQLEAVPSTDDHWDLRLQQSYFKLMGLLSAASSAGVSSPQVRGLWFRAHAFGENCGHCVTLFV
jgi:hypothetical protein